MDRVKRIAASVRHMFPSIPFQDLVSCGYLGLCDAASRYDSSRGSFEKFAYKRIRGAIIDAHKRKAYREVLHYSLEALHPWVASRLLTVDQSPLPEAAALDRERLALAESAIARLPDDERAVLAELLAGAQLADIAAAHGRSTSWVNVRLARGRKNLIEVMERGMA